MKKPRELLAKTLIHDCARPHLDSMQDTPPLLAQADCRLITDDDPQALETAIGRSDNRAPAFQLFKAPRRQYLKPLLELVNLPTLLMQVGAILPSLGFNGLVERWKSITQFLQPHVGNSIRRRAPVSAR